ncbi:MAG: hypothetical protein QOH21_648 [Acidobacteriota bacterium]|jgi:chaperonin cofactor prefoldin|nr:hypothetical protein [Acidobacteriota bacterium]
MSDEELKRLLDMNAAETRRHLDAATERIEGRFDRLESKVDGLESKFAGLETKFDVSVEEMRRHFEVTAEDVKHQVRLVAENVLMVDEKLVREASDIRDEMRTGFANTQAMIKFSHDELHRRVRALEDSQRTVEQTVADLQARVDRLEGTTH